MGISFALSLSCVLCAGTATAQSTASINIGGPGSCSSEGFNDPGRLGDGITEAAAKYTFDLDVTAATLTLTVDNTSPVIVGVGNPLLTDIYFNAPPAVTGMSLTNQTSSSGATPAFVASFDSDLTTNPNPNGADGFGAFSMALENPGGVTGAIGNSAADTYNVPETSIAFDDVTFVFSLTGNLAGVTASDFTTLFSVIPPGNKPVNAVGKFQSGGVAEASGFISNGTEDCFLVIGSTPGWSVWTGPDPNQHSFLTQLGNVSYAGGISLAAPLTAPLPEWLSGGMMIRPGKNRPVSATPVSQFSAQCLMWNPDAYPANPEQYSDVLTVTVWSDGTVTSTHSGTGNGMGIWVETFVGADGRTYLRFPFTIG